MFDPGTYYLEGIKVKQVLGAIWNSYKAPFLPFKLNFRGGREQIDISVYFPTFGIFFCEGRRRWASAVRAHPHLVEETSSLLSQLHRGKKNVLGKKRRLPKI